MHHDGPTTAAALIIGNELLSGKITDTNLPELARLLRTMGVLLRRVVMVLDDVAAIADEVRELAATHDWLFTSGGIGPTHDDVTVAAVAMAFGVREVENPTMRALLQRVYRGRCSEGLLRMAQVPEGAVIETIDDHSWPTVRMHNVWLLPGIPEAFRAKLPVVRAVIGQRSAYVSTAVYTQMEEGDLKPLLDAVVAAFPDVDVGSYPRWRDARYKTKLTFDGLDQARVQEARDAFVATLPSGEPQPIE